jgi:3-hydroxyisobutyrate dehydrogenase-like beta-hydroxyacid dehydrogenase
MKMLLNLMLAGTMELVAEVLVVGETKGLDRAQILEVISNSVDFAFSGTTSARGRADRCAFQLSRRQPARRSRG